MLLSLGIIYCSYFGCIWILRGGAFGAICRKYLNFEPGTTITRLACALIATAPLALLQIPSAFCFITLYIGMTLGYFKESMGQEKQPKDIIWMSVWGLAVMFIAILPLIHLQLTDASFTLLGALAGPIYYINHKLGNGKFDWTQRAEFCTGIVFGAVHFLAAMK